MAQANGRKSSKKTHYPVVREAGLGHLVNTLNVRVLNVDRALSRLNRRLYRQGRYYQVKVDMKNDDGAQYRVFALRDDWAVQKGYQLAYKAYVENTKEEREALGETTARWEDFRVRSGLSHQELLPVLYSASLSTSPISAGEFEESEVRRSNDNAMAFTWGTGDSSQYSILAEYDSAGNAQGSPESSSLGVPYANLQNEINDATAVALQDDGNNPPYDKDGVNTATPWVEVAQLGHTAGSQKLSTGYFTAPCGFVVIWREDSPTWTPENLLFEVKAGDYKGVHAPSMLE